MDNDANANLSFDNGLRFEHLVYMAMALPGDTTVPGALGEVLDEFTAEEIGDIFGQEFRLYRDEDDDNGDDVGIPTEEEFVEYAIEFRLYGFLAKVSTPVRSWNSPTSFSSSWGHFGTKWLYAPTMEELIEKALAWAKERHEKDKSKYLEKQRG